MWGQLSSSFSSSLKVIQHFVHLLIFPTAHQLCRKQKTFRVNLSMFLLYMRSIPVPFRSGFLFVPHRETRHSISPSFQAYTSAPHSFGSFLPFHSASSINSVSHYPSPFLTLTQWYIFIFCGEFAPKNREPQYFPTTHQLLQSSQAIVYYFMCLRSVHSFRLHCAPRTTFVPHSEPLRSITPAFMHPPQHPAA